MRLSAPRFPLRSTESAWLGTCFALALATPTFAVDQPPTAPPAPPTAESTPSEPAPPAPPVPQVVSERRLANGVQVLVQSIPDLTYTTVMLVLHTGENQDPPDAPGLNHLLDRLAVTCVAEGVQTIGIDALNLGYPDGWNSQTMPDHTVIGFVIPSGGTAREVEQAAARLAHLTITEADVDRECAVVDKEITLRFKDRRNQVPISWLIGKTFRRIPEEPRGANPDKLLQLGVERIQSEWRTRTNPSNITLLLCGDVAAVDLDGIVDRVFGSLSAHQPPPPTEVSLRPVGAVAREVLDVKHLPADKDHAVVAYYAPPITDPDHPAFSVVARVFMQQAQRQPGAEVRLAFQYSILVDPRGAYLTPHAWLYPKGAGQALGAWFTKIQKQRFWTDDGERALRATAWQLGADLPGEFTAEIERQPRILYSIAYATAFRSLHGDGAFWSGYRGRMSDLSTKALAAARDKYFDNKDNRALFILRAGR